MSSPSGESKHKKVLESLLDRVRDNLNSGEDGNKPHSKELRCTGGSPISTLRTGTVTATTTATTSSSSSSSGSVSGHTSSGHSPRPPRIPTTPETNSGGHSVEFLASASREGHTRAASGSDGSNSDSPSSATAGERHTRSSTSVVSQPQSPSASQKDRTRSASVGSNPHSLSAAQKGHTRSTSVGPHLAMSSGSVSPAFSRVQFPFHGNICPSGEVKTGMASRSTRSNVLSLGTGEYGHGTVVRGNDYEGIRKKLGEMRSRNSEDARSQFCHHKDPTKTLKTLPSIEKHLTKCSLARMDNDWISTLKEVDAAIDSGADGAHQLLACKAEALLKLHHLTEALSVFSKVPDIATPATKIFGMRSESYILFVRSQIELAKGSFEDALATIEEVVRKEAANKDISTQFSNTRKVVQARARGNYLYKSERYTEASIAYDQGLKLDPSNAHLISNRGSCWYKLGKWERCVVDSDLALQLNPNLHNSLMRRAVANYKLERWEKAVSDYEALRREFPEVPDIAAGYFRAQVELKKSLGEDVTNMKYGGEVELVSTLEQFKASTSSIGAVIVHFKSSSNSECKKISQAFDTICTRFPYVNLLEVDIEKACEVAQSEKVKKVPLIMTCRKGKVVSRMDDPTPDSVVRAAEYFHRLTFK